MFEELRRRRRAALDPAGFAIDTLRPRIDNADGSFSTERTITVGFDNRYYNIPTIWEGRQLSEDEAVSRASRALREGLTFPNFATQEEATAQAASRSEEIGRVRGGQPVIRAGQGLAGVGLPALGKPPEVDRPWLNRIGSAALEGMASLPELQGTLANLASAGLEKVGLPAPIAQLPRFIHETSPVAAAGRALPQGVHDLREGIRDRYDEQRDQFLEAGAEGSPVVNALLDTTAEAGSMFVDPTLAASAAPAAAGRAITRGFSRVAPKAAATLAKPLTQLGAKAAGQVGPLGRYFTYWGKYADAGPELAPLFKQAEVSAAGKALKTQMQVEWDMRRFTDTLDTLAGGDQAKAADLAHDAWRWMTAKDKASVAIPQELLPVVTEMRAAQDGLTRAAVATPGYLGKKGTITASKTAGATPGEGTYLYRFYRATTDPEHLDKVRGTPAWDKATSYYQKVFGMTPERAALAAESVVENAYKAGPKGLFETSPGGAGRVAQSNLKKRQHVPPPLRALLGEETDLRVVYPESMRRLADGLSQHQMFQEMKDLGWGKLFFPPDQGAKAVGQATAAGPAPRQLNLFGPNPAVAAPSPIQATNPMLPPSGYTTVVPDTEFSLGPLRGVATTREMAHFLQGISAAPEVGSWVKTFNRWTKGAMTAGNPASQIRNGYSWMASSLMTGHNPAKVAGKAFRAVANGKLRGRILLPAEEAALTGLAPDFLQAQKLRAAELGVLGEGANAGDVAAHLNLGDRIARKAPQATGLRRAGQVVKEKALDVGRYAQDLYAATDDAAKFYLYVEERAALRKALPSLTDEAVEEMAARNVRNISPTWSMTNQFTAGVRQSPVVGMFPTYYQQVGRNAVEIVKLANAEMTSGNAALARLGARRLAGLTAVVLGPTAAVAGGRYLQGTRGSEVLTGTPYERAVREADAPWERGSDMAVIPRDTPGEATTVNLSYADPLGQYKQIFLEGISRMDEGMISAGTAAIWQYLEPYVGLEALPTTAAEMVTNERREGGEIVNTDIDTGNPLPDVARIGGAYASHAARRLGGPIKNVQRLIGAAIPGGGTAPAERKFPANESLANLAGFPRTTTKDYSETLSRRIWNHTSREGKISDIRDLVRKGNINPQEAQDRFERNVWPELERITQSLRDLRIEERQLADILKEHGVSNEMSYRLRKKQKAPRLRWEPGGR